MADLIAKIKREFSPEYIIEVNVLDGNGDEFRAYNGSVKSISLSHFDKVFQGHACFYMLTILGVDELMAPNLDIHQRNIMRSEFCWLLNPKAPDLIAKGATNAGKFRAFI
jgi:hypothetical protein